MAQNAQELLSARLSCLASLIPEASGSGTTLLQRIPRFVLSFRRAEPCHSGAASLSNPG
jgi:hypothetical protein